MMLLDTHAAVRELESAGMDTAQAEAVVRNIARADRQTATKADLHAAMDSLRTEMRWIRWTIGFLAAFMLAMAGRVFGIV